jgi:bifunctional DNase/RNase
MEVEMKIRTLMMDPVTQMPIVVLRDLEGNSILPIWVGVYEANAIALEIEKIQTPRPLTHDLIKTLLYGMDARVDRIVVNELKDDTFYAVIWVEKDGKMMCLDARPSDALALALRTDAPIFVDESVLANSKVPSSEEKATQNEELRRWLENLNEEDFGRYKM